MSLKILKQKFTFLLVKSDPGLVTSSLFSNLMNGSRSGQSSGLLSSFDFEPVESFFSNESNRPTSLRRIKKPVFFI